MTKFKEYLRAKGIKLECDFEVLPYNGIDGIATYVVDDGIVAEYYHESTGSRYYVYDKYGVYSYFFDSWEFYAYVGGPNCDPEFTSWMCDTSCKISSTLFTVAVGMYENDAKVRVAFKHMRASIMDEKAFYKFLVRQYPKHIRNV